jgi:signal transduction histidine kinase
MQGTSFCAEKPAVELGATIVKSANRLSRVAMFHPLISEVRQSANPSLNQYSDEIMQVLSSAESPVALVVFDRAFRCQTLNASLATMVGQEVGVCLGKHVDEIFRSLSPQIKAALQHVCVAGNHILNCELTGNKPGALSPIGHWKASFFPIVDQSGTPQQFIATFMDITPQQQTKEALILSETRLRALSGQLMSVQDEERRRVARELHDSIGQYLTVLKIKLETNMGHLLLDSRVAQMLAESAVLVEQCLRETRTIAYLLHPPLLDQMGLASALRWYVEGFAIRSGINMSLDITPHFAQLPSALETALYRVVQESLTNIYRHSGSSTASIRLVSDAENIILEVADQGHGVHHDKLQLCASGKTVSGMGIASMKERIRQFGGQLTLTSSNHGTTVTATLPVGAGE